MRVPGYRLRLKRKALFLFNSGLVQGDAFNGNFYSIDSDTHDFLHAFLDPVLDFTGNLRYIYVRGNGSPDLNAHALGDGYDPWFYIPDAVKLGNNLFH